MDPLTTARAGLMSAERRFADSAARVARMGSEDPVDLGHEVVEQIQARTEFAASARIVRLSEEMWRALLEIQQR